MFIDIVEEKNLNNWEKHMHDFNGSPFISTEWLEPFKSSHVIPVYYIYVKNGVNIGITAGLKIESPNRFLKKIYKEMIFFSGPAIGDAEESLAGSCVDSLIDHAKKNGVVKISVKTWYYPIKYDIRHTQFHRIYVEEYHLDLKQELANIYNSIRGSRKREIRKAKENGLIVGEGKSPELVDIFFEQLEETRDTRVAKGRKDYSYKKMPYFSKDLTIKLLSHGGARLFYVQKNKDIIHTMLFCVNNKKAFAMKSGTNADGYKFGAAGLIWYETIRILKEEGVETFSLGGRIQNDSSQDGVTSFKTSFGANQKICTGGHINFLQGNLHKLIYNTYHKLSATRFMAAISKKIKGNYN